MKITAENIRSILDYNAETGVFVWRVRPDMRKEWNTRYAGKVVGHTCLTEYVGLFMDKKNYLMHRLAWLYFYGEWPEKQIDHINGNRMDNRITNLRAATSAENNRNVGLQKRRAGKLKGTSYRHGLKKKWIASIVVDGVKYHLGYHWSEFDAAHAYRLAAEFFFGEFARTA